MRKSQSGHTPAQNGTSSSWTASPATPSGGGHNKDERKAKPTKPKPQSFQSPQSQKNKKIVPIPFLGDRLRCFRPPPVASAELDSVPSSARPRLAPMGFIQSTFSLLVGAAGGIYIAQNYDVPNIKNYMQGLMGKAKELDHAYKKPEDGSKNKA
ncbi:hypothetical protein VPH35_012853 [Triticum aestivum]|uniref:Uncharacterized protein n=2 Tax=Triticinae TaxID=1648030 RepID=A0A3B5ZNL4_WHEAT